MDGKALDKESLHEGQATRGHHCKVLVIGAGLGGLALAQGLRDTGIDVKICEADQSPIARSQGYRIHVNGETTLVLRELLSKETFGRFLRLSEPVGIGFTFLDKSLQELAFFRRSSKSEDPEIGQTRAISRFTLRSLLLSGIQGKILFSQRFNRGEKLTNGRVRAHFDGGNFIDTDLLIGADGTGSKVFRSMVGDPRLVDTGCVTIIGKLRTDDATMSLIPRGNFDHLGTVIGPVGVCLFLSINGDAEHLRLLKQEPTLSPYLDEEPGYSVWAVVARRPELAHMGELQTLPPQELRRVALRAIAKFHPNLEALIGKTIEGSEYCTAIRRSRKMKPWVTDPAFTFLGDSVHTMSPLQGQGANTAFRDANELSLLISRHFAANTSLEEDLSLYEQAILKRGYKAIRRANTIQQWALSAGVRKRSVLLGLRALGRLQAFSKN